VFCAVDMAKDATAKLEDDYARAETPVVSNNSAHRWTPDVPMMIPEINDDHAAGDRGAAPSPRRQRGFVAVKPNCSIQSYVPAIHPLKAFGPNRIAVCTYQAISGAGKTFASWPEMVDNVIPFIKGEEEKSEQEPLQDLGPGDRRRDRAATSPTITAQCLRVPVSDGHMAAVFVGFDKKPSRDEILAAWRDYAGRPQRWPCRARRRRSCSTSRTTPAADPPRSRRRRRPGRHDRPAAPRRGVRLAVRRAVAQHRARRRRRRGLDRGAAGGRRLPRRQVGGRRSAGADGDQAGQGREAAPALAGADDGAAGALGGEVDRGVDVGVGGLDHHRGELVADDPHPTPLVDAAARAVDVGQRDLDRAHRGAEATERERQAAADVVAERGREVELAGADHDLHESLRW
jgi:aspartate-semialdehyde dehydrogenase